MIDRSIYGSGPHQTLVQQEVAPYQIPGPLLIIAWPGPFDAPQTQMPPYLTLFISKYTRTYRAPYHNCNNRIIEINVHFQPRHGQKEIQLFDIINLKRDT